MYVPTTRSVYTCNKSTKIWIRECVSCFYSPPQSAFQCSRLGVGSLPGEDILASLRSKGAMSTKIPGETPWIDAWIRWERKSKEVYDCSADGDGS